MLKGNTVLDHLNELFGRTVRFSGTQDALLEVFIDYNRRNLEPSINKSKHSQTTESRIQTKYSCILFLRALFIWIFNNIV